MKLLLSICLFLLATTTLFAQDESTSTIKSIPPKSKADSIAARTAKDDSVKLIVDGQNVYYQKVVKVDSNITGPVIFLRVQEFMAAKNFQNTFGDDSTGKLIFTSTQDLNNNINTAGDDNDDVDAYSTQFSVTIEVKSGRYRYTISDIVFFKPTATYNRRYTLYEMYQKTKNTDSRRAMRDSNKFLASFERYLTSFTKDMRVYIQHKGKMFKPVF